MIDPLKLQDCKVRIGRGLAQIIQRNYDGSEATDNLAAFIAENIELDPIIDYYEKDGKGQLDALNEAWRLLNPVYLRAFNNLLTSPDSDKLREFEKQHPMIGLKDSTEGVAMSTLSLIATITDLLCGKRIAAQVHAGRIIGWQWYVHNDETPNIDD